nr:MAG TPA: hypothetical protein [Caudoviricetes sp.]
MTRQEKKELLEDFLEQLWMIGVELVRIEQSDYGDGESNIHYEDVDEVIEWYLKGVDLR